MALQPFFPHGYSRNYWDVWDWPQSIFNQNFGLDLAEFENLNRGVTRPLRRELAKKSGQSEVINDPNKFAVKVDVNHFKPEEIKVKTNGNTVTIHGKHEERMDDHGFITREFTRKYVLPSECDADKLVSSLTADGVLTIEAPKKVIENDGKGERLVPITVQKVAQIDKK